MKAAIMHLLLSKGEYIALQNMFCSRSQVPIYWNLEYYIILTKNMQKRIFHLGEGQ